MTDTADVSPTRFAELVAPAITRTFIAGMRSGRDEGRQLVEAYGGKAVGYLIDLRNPLAAGRHVSPAELAAVYRYRESDTIRETVQRSIDGGLLHRDDDGSISASERGQAFLTDLFAMHGRALAERWKQHAERVDRLNSMLARLLATAAATAGPAWAAQAPPYEPPGTPPGVILLNRLSTMRYHRADAHGAAWQAAGLTAAEMIAMPWGTPWSPQREAVEHETNERAAPPFQVLTPGERLTLLADLAALP